MASSIKTLTKTLVSCKTRIQASKNQQENYVSNIHKIDVGVSLSSFQITRLSLSGNKQIKQEFFQHMQMMNR